MKVYLATDHAGFELKEKIKTFLQEKGYDVEDCGAHTVDPQDDYPDFISRAAEKISQNSDDKAIIFGGSGQGEAMVANKFPHVRAMVFNCENLELIPLGREHNNANMLSIGARFVSEAVAKQAVEVFLATAFPGDERHVRRLEKMKVIEDQLSS